MTIIEVIQEILQKQNKREDDMSEVKPHFECSGYGCNGCTKGVIIEEPEITNLKPVKKLPDWFLKVFEGIPLITVDGKQGYFVEIKE